MKKIEMRIGFHPYADRKVVKVTNYENVEEAVKTLGTEKTLRYINSSSQIHEMMIMRARLRKQMVPRICQRCGRTYSRKLKHSTCWRCRRSRRFW